MSEHNRDTGAPAPVWHRLRFEAKAAAASEPTLASYIDAAILTHDTLCSALVYHLAQKLAGPATDALTMRELCRDAYDADDSLVEKAEADLQAVVDRDPACRGLVQPFLFFKGFLALQTYRVAHWLWGQGRDTLAFHFQSRASGLFAPSAYTSCACSNDPPFRRHPGNARPHARLFPRGCHCHCGGFLVAKREMGAT